MDFTRKGTLILKREDWTPEIVARIKQCVATIKTYYAAESGEDNNLLVIQAFDAIHFLAYNVLNNGGRSVGALRDLSALKMALKGRSEERVVTITSYISQLKGLIWELDDYDKIATAISKAVKNQDGAQADQIPAINQSDTQGGSSTSIVETSAPSEHQVSSHAGTESAGSGKGTARYNACKQRVDTQNVERDDVVAAITSLRRFTLTWKAYETIIKKAKRSMATSFDNGGKNIISEAGAVTDFSGLLTLDAPVPQDIPVGDARDFTLSLPGFEIDVSGGVMSFRCNELPGSVINTGQTSPVTMQQLQDGISVTMEGSHVWELDDYSLSVDNGTLRVTRRQGPSADS